MRKLISVAVSLGILAAIYLRLDPRELTLLFAHTDAGWLSLALLTFVPLTLATAIRLQLLARSPLELAESVRLILAASALNVALPSKLGDLVKARFIRDEGIMDGARSLVLVIFEKAFDLLALLSWCALGLISYRGPHEIVLPGVLAAVLIGSALLASRTMAGPFFSFASYLAPSRFARALAALKGAWLEAQLALARDRDRTLGAAAISLAAWYLHLLQIWMFIRALGEHLPLPLALALVPLAILAGLLPFTLAGIGTRDAALVVLLSPYLGAEKSAALGLLCLLRYLLPALAGLPFAGRYLALVRRPA
jgi:hypothetical protein